ncbi:hypothetical protein BW723_16150 [Polaribacter reichenbachii]|uniref:Uncharacterized protein n=1 Tax=Polaribacter reichenbachii TaxID=996801 RepID=A0A1B8U2E0_9FLAO|nr:hypothetical protein [Polaribacter reichenbachii]APZ47732.1 hypothetical protein BW723_16150 [Polaribacter reichenbachii]AUC18366.1 hypothetical protein BTO17_06565 [Polaribacter reichenbachii]OBY66025.1 hypothetical protein LPB301_07305 [Polaribacter reichenbachii]
MQQDIREKLKDYKDDNIELSKKHSNKFEALLQQELHQTKPKNKPFLWLSIAASILLLVSLGIQFYPSENVEEIPTKNKTKEITLGNISPEFNTIETYYVNSINLEISQLDLSEENKDIVDGYLLKIAELTQEYKSLTKELNTNGVNDATIDALVRNLQLRLQLLQRLKKQLKQLKNLNTTQNETQII